MESQPKFRVDGKDIKTAKVIILCSNCDVDIRQMSKTESLDPRKGIYCAKCDDGVVRLNMKV